MALRPGCRGRLGAALPAGESRIDRPCGKEQARGSFGVTRFRMKASALECLSEAQQMTMDAEGPCPDPRPTTRHQTTPRPADSFVQRPQRTRNLPQRGMSGDSGRPGRGNRPGPISNSAIPCSSEETRTSTRVTRSYSMAPAPGDVAIATHSIVPAGSKQPASPDARSLLLA